VSLLKQSAYYLGLIAAWRPSGRRHGLAHLSVHTAGCLAVSMTAPLEASGTGGEKPKMQLFTPDEDRGLDPQAGG